jgi:hypothetical protein
VTGFAITERKDAFLFRSLNNLLIASQHGLRNYIIVKKLTKKQRSLTQKETP